MNPVRPLLRLIARIIAYGVIVPLLTLVEPFLRVRLTHLWTARFGPLCIVGHNWVVERRFKGPEPRTLRIFYGARPANRQLWEMWKRVMPIIDSPVLSALYHYAGPNIHKVRFFKPIDEQLSNYARVNHHSGLAFTPDEVRRGEELLRVMGIGPDDWFITFQSRDGSYHVDKGTPGDSGEHRNIRIEAYLPAVNDILALGGKAVRMGAVVERPLPEDRDPRIIDYPRQFRSEFGDIWLFSRCRFHLGGSTGSTNCPALFGRPVAQANMYPLRPVPMGRSGLYTPVVMRDVKSKTLVPYDDLEKMGAFIYDDRAIFLRWQLPSGLDEMGLEIVPNSPEEIRALCRDMLDRLDGRPVDPDIAAFQGWYKQRYFPHVPTITDAPDLAPSFIRSYRHLFP